MTWRLETTPKFERLMRNLDRQVARSIKSYLEEICTLENPRTRGKALVRSLKDYWRYRVGDYRILVEIYEDKLVIVAVEVGHRRDVYQRR